MRTFYSYDDMWRSQAQQPQEPVLLEAYSGDAIVGWYGTIERQLERMLEDAEASRNFPYADKLRQFITTWRENEITGSLNREVLVTLKTASTLYAVDSWNLKNYFSNLRDQLRKLLASEEELPRMDDGGNEPPKPGGMGGGGGGAPLAPEFGPEEDKPPDAPEDAGDLGDLDAGAPGPEDDGPTADKPEVELKP
jgi:hypothetical protein